MALFDDLQNEIAALEAQQAAIPGVTAGPGSFETALGQVNLGGQTSVGTSGFSNIDALISARTPEALGLIRSGTTEALRLSGLGAAEAEALRPFTGLEAFDEQQAILGLSGVEAQEAALAGIPISQFEQEAQRRQRETQLRQASATGDIGSGFALQQAQQLSGAQQLQNIQGRLAQLEPFAGIARSTRSTLSQQAEAAGAQQAQLLSGQGTQLANIRLGVAAPQIASIQQRAELSGLQGIQKAQQSAATANQIAGLAGQFAPQIGNLFGGGAPTIAPVNSLAAAPNIPSSSIGP